MPAAVAVPLIVGGLSAGATAYAAGKSSSAARRAAAGQTDAANHAADLEASSAGDQLAFARQQEAARQKEWQDTQARNFQIYQQKQNMLAPYRNLGTGAIGQLMNPIQQRPQPAPNGVASIMGGQ